MRVKHLFQINDQVYEKYLTITIRCRLHQCINIVQGYESNITIYLWCRRRTTPLNSMNCIKYIKILGEV